MTTAMDSSSISCNNARARTKLMTANIERPVRGLIADDRVNGLTKTDVPKKMIHKMKKVQVLYLK